MNSQQTQLAVQPKSQDDSRKAYTTPQLTVMGFVKELTQTVSLGSQPVVSDRNLKECFRSVDAQQILEQVVGLAISTWNYKSEARSIRHLGPMAQDFAAAFNVGEDDRHIHMVDASGVALAAIQGLYDLLQRQEKRIGELEAQLEASRAESCVA